jgi:hypothetical protein
MGRSVRIGTVLQMVFAGGQKMQMEWQVGKRGPFPGYGKPTQANLINFIETFERSHQPGGVNERIGPTKVLHAEVSGDHSGAYTPDPAAYEEFLAADKAARAEFAAWVATQAE